MEKYTREYLGFDKADIKDDLSEYYSLIRRSKAMVTRIERKWESVETYVDALYWMKYIQKYSYRQIADLLQMRQDGVAQMYILLPFAWHYSTNNFEEVKALAQSDMQKIRSAISECTESNPIFSTDEYLKFCDSFKGKLPRCSLSKMGLSEDEFFRILYLLYIKRKYSVKEISLGLDISYAKLDGLLKKKMKICLPRKEAAERAACRRDYNRIYKKGRETSRLEFYDSGLEGSVAENAFRTILESKAKDFFFLEQYDVIIVINNRTIIYPYEVDIPIVVFEKNSSRNFRFAVEFNGAYWHEKGADRDNSKKKLLEHKGWVYIPVEFSNDASNNSNLFYQEASNSVYRKIKKVIENS